MKNIVQQLKTQLGIQDQPDETDRSSLHPLLQKITAQRWFPREITKINVDSVVEAIAVRLGEPTKSIVKMLIPQLIEIDQ